MLSIGKLAAGPDAGRYYEQAVASGREDYYTGEGEAPGRWLGAGSQGLGLAGEVAEGDVVRLLAGEHPGSGELLGRPLTEGSVAGFDLTFKPPKSVSILFGIADEHVAAQLAAGHQAAVSEALGYLEREACRARRGKDGLLVVTGNGFLAAGFRHRASRAGDPLLHDHVVVSNRTQGPDGRYTALDGRPLLRHAKTAGFLYQATLRRELSERLGLSWGEVRKGSAELAGFSREVIEHFSRRRAEIVAEMALHDGHSLYSSQAAALATRKGKDYGVPAERLREDWRARAAEFGLDRAEIDRLLLPQLVERDPEPLTATDLRALTEQASTFTRRDVIQMIAASRQAGARVDEIESLAETILADREMVQLSADRLGETRYTTRELLELERDLLQTSHERRDEHVAVARPDRTERAIAQRSLSDEQADLVRALTQEGDGVAIVRAAAGTGKTFALDAAREAWQRSGRKVIGCALSARAAAELREQAAIDTTTIARLKIALDHGERLPFGGVLVVDEAGMVGTRDLAHLARAADEHHAKLVLVGDDRQLPEIEAGGAFRALAKQLGAHELHEVRRQREAWDRQALTDLREGRVEQWAAAYQREGRLVCGPNAPAVREQLASDWWQARETGGDAVMIALRTSDVADLNQRARTRMREHGRLRGEDIQLGERNFAEGDDVVLRRNDQRLGVINGDRATVTSISETQIDVKHRDGRETRLPDHYARDGHLDHGYATTAHRAQGATVDQAFVLGSDETYREWGYTALSRHRDSARYYITAPQPFLNRLSEPTLDPEQVKDTVQRTFSDSRAQQLALDAYDRDPRTAGLVERLADTHDQANETRQRAFDTRAEMEATPWYRRRDRDELRGRLEGNERAAEHYHDQTERLGEQLDERLQDQPSPRPANDPYADRDRHDPGRDRDLLPGRELNSHRHPHLPDLNTAPPPPLRPPPSDIDLGMDFGP